MPALPPHVLYARLQAALPVGSTIQSAADETHPMLVDVLGIGQVRAYLWTVTPSTGRRLLDEFKIQITLPGSGQLNLAPPHLTLLLGFSPEFGVFTGWEANLYPEVGSSPNVQVKEGLLEEARDSGWAVAKPRNVKAGPEVRVAFSPANCGHFLSVTKEANAQGLSGQAREAFFIFRTPGTTQPQLPTGAAELQRYADRQRQRLAATRLSRDARFSPKVKKAYGYSCAICGIRMEVVEGAHIIEVREEGSTDEEWNGIALCAVHHKLFDAHVLVIRPTLEIVVNNDAVQHLRDRGREAGIDYFVLRHRDQELTPPDFFATDQSLRNAMVEALRQRAQRAGLV